MPPVKLLETCGSTNEEGLRAAAFGATGPLWLRAKQQTAGRGRQARVWQSPPGNLYASLLLPDQVPQPEAFPLSLLAGIALFDAVAQAVAAHNEGGAAPQIHLKWPNDLLWQRRKLGGILVESQCRPKSKQAPSKRPPSKRFDMVIGFGLNICFHPQDVARPAAHLQQICNAVTVADVFGALQNTMAKWLDCAASSAQLRTAWQKRALMLGTPIAVHMPDGHLQQGQFFGISKDGALRLLLADGREVLLRAGDIALL